MADSHALYATGTTNPISGVTVGTSTFDVVNTGTSYLEVAFVQTSTATFTPSRANLAPNARQTITCDASATQTVTYYTSYYSTANPNSSYRYVGNRRGRVVGIAPIGSANYSGMVARSTSVHSANRFTFTAGAIVGQTAFGASPDYGHKTYGTDALFTIESGESAIPAVDIKNTVDINLALQLTEEYNYCPAGSLPDVIEQDGTEMGWGTETVEWPWYTREPHLRADLTKSLCPAQMAHIYGQRTGFDASWQSWFNSIKTKLANAYGVFTQTIADNNNKALINPSTGLIRQYEVYPSCTWSTLDIIKQTGDLIGLSILACNYARAMADMFEIVSDSSGVTLWNGRATAMASAIQAQFITVPQGGYLPWNTGNMPWFSPEYTGYAVWSGVLTQAQDEAASDWFAYLFEQDKTNYPNGKGDLFDRRAGSRGLLRRARRQDDYDPTGVKLGAQSSWPDWFPTKTQWYDQRIGGSRYGEGLNGDAYASRSANWINAALAIKHLDLAIEHASMLVADTLADPNAQYEEVYATGYKQMGQYLHATTMVQATAAPGTASSFYIRELGCVDFLVEMPGEIPSGSVDFLVEMPPLADGSVDFLVQFPSLLPVDPGEGSRTLTLNEPHRTLSVSETSRTLTITEPIRTLELDV